MSLPEVKRLNKPRRWGFELIKELPEPANSKDNIIQDDEIDGLPDNKPKLSHKPSESEPTQTTAAPPPKVEAPLPQPRRSPQVRNVSRNAPAQKIQRFSAPPMRAANPQEEEMRQMRDYINQLEQEKAQSRPKTRIPENYPQPSRIQPNQPEAAQAGGFSVQSIALLGAGGAALWFLLSKGQGGPPPQVGAQAAPVIQTPMPPMNINYAQGW